MSPSTTKPRGRPREFDVDEAVQQSVEVFWRNGFSGTTTRTLEQHLGISQSSLYHAFQSKEGLFEEVLVCYEAKLHQTVLSTLERDDPDRDTIIEFLDAVTRWIRNDRHRGCLVLNLAADAGQEAIDGSRRLRAYRKTLRRLLEPAVASFTSDPADTDARVEMLVAAILGLNISATSGASKAELSGMRNAIVHQVRAW